MRNCKNFIGSSDVRGSRTRRSISLVAVVVLALLGHSGCVTKSAASTEGELNVTFTQTAPGSLQTGGVIELTASVANDPSNMGVVWNVSCSSPKCGSFNPTQTLSGATTVYTAPTAIPVGNTVNLTAMAAANHAISQTVSVTITNSITIAFTQAPTSPLGAGSSEAVVAQVTGDATGAGVTWSVSCAGSSNCGSMAPLQTLSGSPSTYTAPTGLTSNLTVSIIATSTASSLAFVSGSVTVTPSAAISVVFTTGEAPPATMATGAAVNVAATVSNDIANAGVDWTMSCTPGTGGTCGTFSLLHTASGSATLYTAPTVVPATAVTITATSTTDHTKFASAMVTVSVPVISIAFSVSPPSSMPVSGTASISATVANDSAGKGVDWTVTCAVAAPGCGTFNLAPPHTLSGASIIYTAPAAVPSGNTITITATSTADSTKFVTATVTITPSTAISIAFTSGHAPPTTMLVSATANIAATVTNDATNAGVNWTVTCPNAPPGCGTLTPTNTASAATTAYQSPTAVPTGGSVTITATAAADSTKSVSANVTITLPTITVVFTTGEVPPATLAVSGTASMAATVTGDPSNSGVNWTVTCGSTSVPPNCGSFDPTSSASGVTTIYTAPTAIPPGTSATITATSVADNTKTATASVNITASVSDGLLQGKFAFSLVGTNPLGFFGAVGSLSLDGSGGVTGQEDFYCAYFRCDSGEFEVPVTGSYTLGPDGRGSMIINTGVSAIGVSGTQTLSLTVVIASPSTSARALIIEFDTGNASGSLDLQETSAFSTGLSGSSYAFLFPGYDLVNGGTTDAGGVFSASGGSFTGKEDINDSGVPSVTENATFSGTYTAADSVFGRGTFAASNGDTFAYYVVNAGFVKFLEIDDSFISVGPAYTQGSSFATGTTYAFTAGGVDINIDSLVMGGLFTPSGSSTLSGVVDVNDGGSPLVSNASFTTGSFTAPSGGRATITFPSAVTGTGGNPGPSLFAVYPTQSQGLLLLDLDTGASFTAVGGAFAQSSPAFSGTYAMTFSGPATVDADDAVGQVTANPTNSPELQPGTVDLNDGGITNPGLSLTGSYTTNGNGRYAGSLTIGSTSQNEVFYLVNANMVLCIETAASGQTAGFFEAQNLTP
jgi:hypothetical protein